MRRYIRTSEYNEQVNNNIEDIKLKQVVLFEIPSRDYVLKTVIQSIPLLIDSLEFHLFSAKYNEFCSLSSLAQLKFTRTCIVFFFPCLSKLR